MEENTESECVLPVESELTVEKQNLKEFIFQLEALPELWDSSAKVYSDKAKKIDAYKKLVVIYKKIKPTATVDDVRKKINSLRSNYRKDLKRVVDSKRSGAGADVVYTPKAWTFQALRFLQKTINVSMGPEYESDSVKIGARSRSPEELDDFSFSSVRTILPPKKKLKSGSIVKQNELIENDCSLLSEKPQSPNRKTNATAIYWSEKLDKLPQNQRMFAEKAINDILFEAEMGTLNRNSVKINEHSTSAVITPEPNMYVSTSSSEHLYFKIE